MILTLFAVFGALIGLAFRSGTPKALRVRALALPIFAYLFKMLAARALTPQALALPVCILQYGLLFGFLFCNRNLPRASMLLLTLGTFMNFAVIALNGGCMPVDSALIPAGSERLTRLLESGIYAYAPVRADTVFAFLGDVLPLQMGGLRGFFSIGDLIMGVGAGGLCFSLVRNIPRANQTNNV